MTHCVSPWRPTRNRKYDGEAQSELCENQTVRVAAPAPNSTDIVVYI